MKICNKCSRDLDDSAFCMKRGKLNTQCRDCVAKYYKTYVNDSPTRREKMKKHFSKYKQSVKEYVRSLKEGKPCVDCGGVFHFAAMDFDHLPGFTKSCTVSLMASASRETVDREVAKCELVCANCHRVRTYKRRSRS